MKLFITILTFLVIQNLKAQIPLTFPSGLYEQSDSGYKKIIDGHIWNNVEYDTLTKVFGYNSSRWVIKNHQSLLCSIEPKIVKGGLRIQIIYPDLTLVAIFIKSSDFFQAGAFYKYLTGKIEILIGPGNSSTLLSSIPINYKTKEVVLHLTPKNWLRKVIF